jgi:serine phosphatase RsbU (regulator of sigma subunit)
MSRSASKEKMIDKMKKGELHPVSDAITDEVKAEQAKSAQAAQDSQVVIETVQEKAPDIDPEKEAAFFSDAYRLRVNRNGLEDHEGARPHIRQAREFYRSARLAMERGDDKKEMSHTAEYRASLSRARVQIQKALDEITGLISDGII